MNKTIKYWIFKTKWGYFGITGTEDGLLRTFLPQSNRQDVERQILKAFPSTKSEKKPFEKAIKAVLEYFASKKVDFANVPVSLEALRPFAKKVLCACRDIPSASTISYRELAKKIGRPNACRAVGTVMAKNPLPLIIPCHRIIRSDGKLGGFSAPSGLSTKKKLIDIEKRAAAKATPYE